MLHANVSARLWLQAAGLCSDMSPLSCHEQVFDLGADGLGHPHEVAEVANFQKAAAAAGNGRDIFGGRTPADRKGIAVAHIAVIPPTQSVR